MVTKIGEARLELAKLMKIRWELTKFKLARGSGVDSDCSKWVFSEGRRWGVGSVVVGSAFGAPQIFAPNRSETLQNQGFGASGLKIGAPQKRRFNDHGSNAPFSALWVFDPETTRIAWSGFLQKLTFKVQYWNFGCLDCSDCSKPNNWPSKPNYCNNWLSKVNFWVSGNPSQSEQSESTPNTRV